MKILIVNTVYSSGSTGKIAKALHSYLQDKGISSYVLYGRGKNADAANVFKVSYDLETLLHAFLSRLTGLQGFYSYFSTIKLIRKIKEISPDVVHVLNMHGYYLNEFKLFNFLSKSRIPVVYSMLDEYPYVGKCCYPYDCTNFNSGCGNCPQLRSYPQSFFFDTSKIIFNRKKRSYSLLERIVFTGPQWVVQRARSSALLIGKRIENIDEFVETSKIFYPRDSSSLRNRLGIDADCKVVLNVCSFKDQRKGAAYYVELARQLAFEKIVFVHVGFDGVNIDLPGNYIAVPYVSSFEELAVYYSMADIFVCTSLADTMPNVCLEALACGTPVCGFDGGGTSYTAEEPFGKFVSNGDVQALKSIIVSCSIKNNASVKKCRDYAVGRYSVEVVCASFVDLYKKLIGYIK